MPSGKESQMKQQVVELVHVILQHLEQRDGAPLSKHGMRTWLVRQGYSKKDIEAALGMVWPRLGGGDLAVRPRKAVFRQFSPYERYKLSLEARDALTRLDIYELIDPYEMELLLERLGQLEGEVGLDELDYLLSWILCSTRDVESQQTLFRVFEGDNGTLH